MTQSQRPNPRQTALARARYDRIAPVYDLMNLCAEFVYRRWREWLWQQIPRHGRILEVGVGTGKSLPYHPRNAQVIGIDLSPKMLARAQRLKQQLGAPTELVLGDAQALDLPDDSIDAALASFVFCSVPDPVLAFSELRRVVRPGGRVYLLEHMRPASEFVGRLMDLVNPLVVSLMGFNINRRTLGNIQKAELEIERVQDVGLGGIFKIIVAHPRK
ncbi:MAG: class I SAM-dependent methyltransferase [Anaerolineales bacterium]